MEATKVGEDSSIQRMIRLVQSADAGKAKIVGLADRWATWSVVIALSTAGLTWLITGQIIRAVTILVVFCPCALVLATPTAIMAAIGNATKHGFLVREGDALERLSKAKVIAFDKTGTLTYGTPEVVAAESVSKSFDKDKIYRLAASAEQFSEHPLGKAIVGCYKKTCAVPASATDFSMIPGRGVCAVVDGKTIFAGNPKLLSEHGVTMTPPQDAMDYLSKGCTVTYVAVNGQFAGYLALSDTLRVESAATVDSLTRLGVQPVLLTGNNENAAKAIAGKLHIGEVRANCLPEDKLKYIGEYQGKNLPVCMIGDGVNDSPALSEADAGIAIATGAAIAREIADITISSEDLFELVTLRRLSEALMDRIHRNYRFIVGFNCSLIALGVAGILPPATSALLHNLSTLAVSMKSMTNLLPEEEE